MKTDKEQLAITIMQEDTLCFPTITTEMILDIAKSLSEELHRKKSPSFLIAQVNGRSLYTESFPHASIDNENWARRKGNTTLLLGKSSYRVTLEMRINGKDLSNRGVAISEYALSGGAFPIKINDLVIGYLGLSGTTQEEEHQLIADAIANYQNKKIPSIFD